MRTGDAASDGLTPRIALAGPVWLGWAVAAVLLTAGPFLWHLDYFAQTGPHFRTAILAVLALLAAGAWGYNRFWPGSLRGLELRWFFGAALGVTLLQEPRATVVMLAFAAASYAIGAAALGRLGLEPASALERLVLSTSAGLGCWVVALIPLGLAGLYRSWVFASLIAASLVLFRNRLPGAMRELRRIEAAWCEVARQRSPLLAVVVVFLPAFAAAFWLAAMAPATATDPIAFHMSAVRHYLLTQKLSPLPVLPEAYDADGRLFSLGHSAAYSYYPQSFEELQTVLWALGGQPAAQLVSPLFFFLAVLLAGAVGRRCGVSRLAAVLGVAAAAAIPVVSWSGAIAKNDAMLACFELAALLAAVAARDGVARKWLLLSAFFVGLSFGTKHVALYGAIPIGLLMLNRARRERAPLRLVLLLAVVCAATGFSWHARTWLATGNPLYPADIGYAAVALPAIGGTTPTPWLDRAIFPWVAHFEGRLANEGPSDNPLGFFFVFFGAAWLLWRRRERSPAEWDCLLFCGLYAAYWIYSWGVLRYGVPLLLLLAVLTAARVEAIMTAPALWVRRVASAALAYSFAFALLPTLMLEVNEHQLRYFARRIDREGYLRAMLKEYPSIEYLNAQMNDAEWALAFNNCAIAYARDPARFRCLELRGTFSEDRRRGVEAVIVASRPEFLVLAKDAYGRALRPAAEALGYRILVYEDAAYWVLERAGPD